MFTMLDVGADDTLDLEILSHTRRLPNVALVMDIADEPLRPKQVRTSIGICGVCGDKAFFHNFNAMTCQACKAFFRRNATKKKKWKCPFRGTCFLTHNTRKCCRACRLAKCFDIGMKPELIRAVGNDTHSVACMVRGVGGVGHRGPRPSISWDALCAKSSQEEEDELFYYYERHRMDSPLPYVLEDFTHSSADSFGARHDGEFASRASQRNVVISLIMTSSLLGQFEQEQFLEAVTHFNISTSAGKVQPASTSCALVSHWLDYAVREITSAAKSMSAFKRRSDQEQINLLKDTAVDVMFVRSLYYFVPERRQLCWSYATDIGTRCDACFELRQLKDIDEQFYESYIDFAMSIGQHLREDKFLISLLSVIALFSHRSSPTQGCLSSDNTKEAFMEILKKYFILTFKSYAEAFVTFHDLMNKMSALKALKMKLENLNPNLVDHIISLQVSSA